MCINYLRRSSSSLARTRKVVNAPPTIWFSTPALASMAQVWEFFTTVLGNRRLLDVDMAGMSTTRCHEWQVYRDPRCCWKALCPGCRDGGQFLRPTLKRGPAWHIKQRYSNAKRMTHCRVFMSLNKWLIGYLRSLKLCCRAYLSRNGTPFYHTTPPKMAV